jgi:uncharacterized membrane protein HdeD (DUF308 family)
MDLSTVVSILPVPIIAFVYGLTYMIKTFLEKQDVNGKPTQTLPAWFLAVPCLLGLAGGILYFFQANTTEVLLAMTFGRKVTGVLWNSVTFAGASVLLWEGWKDVLAMFKAKTGGS